MGHVTVGADEKPGTPFLLALPHSQGLSACLVSEEMSGFLSYKTKVLLILLLSYVEHLLSEMLGARSVDEFLQIFEYLQVHNEVSWG